MANQKRIESCRRVGEHVRRQGHTFENDFLAQFNPSEVDSAPSYRPEADTRIDESNPVYQFLIKKLGVMGNSVTNKSSNNIQFTLGKVPEVEICKESLENLNNVTFFRSLLDKYFRKSNSDIPAHILCYHHDALKCWVFFSVEEVITYMCNRCSWRLTSAGRSLKGDFPDASRKGKRQYLTIEVRRGKGVFFGANGNRGRPLIDLFMHPEFGIPHHIEEVRVSEAKI